MKVIIQSSKHTGSKGGHANKSEEEANYLSVSVEGDNTASPDENPNKVAMAYKEVMEELNKKEDK